MKASHGAGLLIIYKGDNHERFRKDREPGAISCRQRFWQGEGHVVLLFDEAGILLCSGKQDRVLRYVTTRIVRLPVNSTEASPESREIPTWQSFRSELLRFIRRRGPDKALAEDIVQDVLLKAYEHRGDLKDARKFRPWLYQITRNALIDHYRSAKRLEELPENLAGENPDENHHSWQELARCLRPLLAELPAGYRRALTVTEFEGVTQKELASREGLSLSGAKSRVQRARQMLREVLLRCCREEADQRGGMDECENDVTCKECGHSEGLRLIPITKPMTVRPGRKIRNA